MIMFSCNNNLSIGLNFRECNRKRFKIATRFEKMYLLYYKLNHRVIYFEKHFEQFNSWSFQTNNIIVSVVQWKSYY